MKTHTERTLKLLVLSAMFAAMTTVLTFFIKIPTAGGGYIHLGDAVIYLAACFLPTPYAMLSAGVGGALSDLFGGYFVYLFPTFLIKALIALPFSRKAEKILTSRNACMVLPAGVITVAGYYLTKVFLLAFDQATTSQGFWGAFTNPVTWGAALENIPENTIQAVGSAVVFLVAALALDKANLKQKLLPYTAAKA